MMEDHIFWIAKDAEGGVTAGAYVDGEGPWWALRLTPGGWQHQAGDSPPMPPEDATEAIGELCIRAHAARLMHCDVDDPKPWPDAPGPWRLEMSARALAQPAED